MVGLESLGAVGPAMRRDALWTALGLSALILALGYWLKARCLDHAWGGGFEFRNFCYNDLHPLYFINGYADGGIPYVTVQSEYPVLTGGLAWVLALLFDSHAAWWHANAALLFAAGLGVTWLLVQAGHDWRSAAPWVLAPSIVADGFTNWDLWAVFLMVAGLVAFERGRLFLAALLIGLGTAAKLFPAVAGLAMLLVVVNRGRAGQGWRREVALLAGGFALGWLPLNLAYAMLNPELWLRTYQFHAERGTSFQTLYYLFDQYVVMPRLGYGLTVGQFNLASLVATVGATALIAGLALRRRTVQVHLLAAAFLAAYVVAGKFFSPQYTLWLLPLFVLAGLPRPLWWVFTAAHLASFVWAYHLRMPPPGALEGMSGEFLAPFNLASFVLMFSIVMVAVLAVDRLRAPDGH
ncbi:MAG: hypothetical protein QOD77_1603 [Thermoplasmata archaeon]|jgi:hypothetical protein|nr:hypothetical protein [Thermoplasmata archaeon]